MFFSEKNTCELLQFVSVMLRNKSRTFHCDVQDSCQNLVFFSWFKPSKIWQNVFVFDIFLFC